MRAVTEGLEGALRSWQTRWLCLAGSAGLAFRGLRPMLEDWRNVSTGIWACLASAALLLVAASLSAAPRKPEAEGRRAGFVSFVLIFAIAVFFRTYAFRDLPPIHGVGSEENLRAGRVFAFMHSEFWTPVYPLLLVVTAGSFERFGFSIQAMRLPMVATGLVGVGFFFLLARDLFEREVAWFVAGLWAVCRIASFTTRLLDELFFDVTFVVVTLYVLVRAVKTARPVWFAWLGLLCAYLSYEYIAFKLLPVLIVLYLAFGAARAGRARDGQPAAILWCAFYFVAAAALGLAPLFINGEQIGYFRDALTRHGAMGRLRTDGIFGIAQECLSGLRATFAVILYSPSGDPLLANPDRPLLGPGTAVLAAAGVLYSVLTVRRPFRALLLACLVLLLAPAAAVANNFWVPRFVVVAPILILLAGMPLDDLWKATRPRGGWLRTAVAGLLCIGFMIEAEHNFRALFVEARNDPRVRLAYRDPLLAISFYGNARRGRTGVYAWSETEDLSNLYWESDYRWAWPQPRTEGRPLAQPFEELPLHSPGPAPPAAFAVVQSSLKRTDWAECFRIFYPGVEANPGLLDYPGPPDEAFVIEVPVALQEGRKGLWVERGPGSAAARLRGLVYLAGTEARRFSVAGARRCTLHLDGSKVLEAARREQESVSIVTVPGWHPIAIDLEPDPVAHRIELRARREGEPARVVPPEDLFAMERFQGLVCTRSLRAEDGTIATEQRVQPGPWPLNTDTLRYNTRHEPLPRVFAEEACAGFLRVEPEVDSSLSMRAHSGTARLSIDGHPAATAAAGPSGTTSSEVPLRLSPGLHRIELRFESAGAGRIAGASLLWRKEDGSWSVRPPAQLTPVPPIASP